MDWTLDSGWQWNGVGVEYEKVEGVRKKGDVGGVRMIHRRRKEKEEEEGEEERIAEGFLRKNKVLVLCGIMCSLRMGANPRAFVCLSGHGGGQYERTPLYLHKLVARPHESSRFEFRALCFTLPFGVGTSVELLEPAAEKALRKPVYRCWVPVYLDPGTRSHVCSTGGKGAQRQPPSLSFAESGVLVALGYTTGRNSTWRNAGRVRTTQALSAARGGPLGGPLLTRVSRKLRQPC